MEIFKKGVKEWERGGCPKKEGIGRWGRAWGGGGGGGGGGGQPPPPPPIPNNLQTEDEPTKEKHVKNMRGGLPALFSGSCGQFAFHM